MCESRLELIEKLQGPDKMSTDSQRFLNLIFSNSRNVGIINATAILYMI